MPSIPQQPAVQLGQDLLIPGREGKFILFSAGTKTGRYWAVQRRPGQPSINVEVYRTSAHAPWQECRD